MRVEVARQSASSLVPKEVALGHELTGVVVFGLTKLKLFLNEQNEQLLCVNLRDLDVAMRVSVKEEL